MASRLTILRGRIRLCRTKLGTVFLFLLGIASILCVLNWISNSYTRHVTAVLDYESTGRHLAGLPGGEHLMAAYHGHRRRKRPKASDKEDQVCKVPKLSLETDTNRHAYYDMGTLSCAGQHLFYLEDLMLRLNRTVLGSRKLAHCIYRGIDRISDSYHTYSYPLKRTDNFEIKVKNDFFRVTCYTNNSQKRQDYMVDDGFHELHRRRLFQLNAGDDEKRRSQNKEVKVEYHGSVITSHVPHSPKIYGSMGLPDLPDSMLNQQRHVEKSKVNNAEVKQMSKLVGEEMSVQQRKPKMLRLQPVLVEKNAQQRQLQQLQQQEEVKQQQIGNEIPQNVQETQKQKSVSGARLNIKEQNIERADVSAERRMDLTRHDEVNLNKIKPPEEVEFKPQNDYDNNFMNAYDWEEYEPDFDQFFVQVHPKHNVLERAAHVHPFVNSTQMNVLMFALDSMSHMSYQRMLPKTYAYLKQTLGAIILDAYNIVGDATTAAIIPILTGQTELELPETRVNKEGSHYVDIYPFIWNKFEQSGYVTLYAEDQPSLGTFQLRLNGFEETPVDHYMRPFWQAALDSEVHEGSLKYCLGGKPEHQYTLDYLRDLFIKYPKVPKFAFGFIGELSHADNNPAQYIDTDLMNFLKYLRLNGYLDNTLLIVMGDHGARYSAVRQTTQGKLEERLPMMSLTFPEKFKKQYPHLMNNLKENKQRLSTPFDLHETLKTVLNIYNAEKSIRYTDRGISLLNTIPTNRTCASAGIALHWCTCMQSEDLDIKDPKVKEVAEHIVSHINSKLYPIQDLCAKLSLKRILEAGMVFPNEQVLKYLQSKDSDNRIANFSQTIKLDILHYQLTIETSPNEGLYEATVQAVIAKGSFSIVGDISRINRYGDQPHCIIAKHPDLRKFCFCMSKPTLAPKNNHHKMKKPKMN